MSKLDDQDHARELAYEQLGVAIDHIEVEGHDEKRSYTVFVNTSGKTILPFKIKNYAAFSKRGTWDDLAHCFTGKRMAMSMGSARNAAVRANITPMFEKWLDNISALIQDDFTDAQYGAEDMGLKERQPE